MELLEIEATDESPQIRFDPYKGLLEINGKSLPEHIQEFYKPLDDAVRKYVQNPLPVTNIMFNLVYLNSSSTKKILEIVTHFEEVAKRGLVVNFLWFYKENDEDMLEEGEGFARLTSLSMQLVMYKDKNWD
jgi:hypothetical protein